MAEYPKRLIEDVTLEEVLEALDREREAYCREHNVQT
jgi:hypothetical protein